MKKIAILMIALIFGLWGCQKDSMLDPSNSDNGNSQDLKCFKVPKTRTYELRGTFLNTNPIPLLTPSTPPQQYGMQFVVSGFCNHLGLVDKTKSWLKKTGMPINGYTIEIVLFGMDGSSLHFLGNNTIVDENGLQLTDFIIDSGTKRFNGATGWFKTKSSWDAVNMINHVKGYGEITITKK
jgi:hypothetical protein